MDAFFGHSDNGNGKDGLTYRGGRKQNGRLALQQPALLTRHGPRSTAVPGQDPTQHWRVHPHHHQQQLCWPHPCVWCPQYQLQHVEQVLQHECHLADEQAPAICQHSDVAQAAMAQLVWSKLMLALQQHQLKVRVAVQQSAVQVGVGPAVEID